MNFFEKAIKFWQVCESLWLIKFQPIFCGRNKEYELSFHQVDSKNIFTKNK